jgi:hypothetical protein
MLSGNMVQNYRAEKLASSGHYSRQANSSGTDGSNPLRSATQSGMLPYIMEKR